MKDKTTKARKGTIKLATPVPFVGLEHKDLVAVSLEDLTEAQKEHEKEVEQAKLEVIEEIEKNLMLYVERVGELHDVKINTAYIDFADLKKFLNNLKKEIKEE